jgi:hypothetical protein
LGYGGGDTASGAQANALVDLLDIVKTGLAAAVRGASMSKGGRKFRHRLRISGHFAPLPGPGPRADHSLLTDSHPDAGSRMPF